MSVLIEIRAGEGGADARLLVYEQLSVYSRYAKRRGLELTVLEAAPAVAVVRVAGRGAREAFAHEAGGHRWQRVPPTEKRGRVHSSTVTVAVLDEQPAHAFELNPAQLRYEHYCASGPGGQHRNTSDTAVRVTHLPTGVQACSETKSRSRNTQLALEVLRARLVERERRAQRTARNQARREQVGSGMRADKVRTVAEQRGRVEDHRSGRRLALKAYKRGELERLLG